MEIYLVLLGVILLFTAMKYLIDINTLVLKINKTKNLNHQHSDLEEKYLFIKGLY